jgi:glutaminase
MAKLRFVAIAVVFALAMIGSRAEAADLDAATIERVLKEAHAKFAGLSEGANADYIPALAKVPSKLFGMALVTPDGKVYATGDSQALFSIQSISKVFTMARVMQDSGDEVFPETVGVDATGQVFNSIVAVEQYKGHQMNPLVNPGAIATTGMLKGAKDADKWSRVLTTHEAFAGRKLEVNKEVYESEAATNQRNQAIAALMLRVRADPGRPRRWSRTCIRGSARSTSPRRTSRSWPGRYANGGKNPVTKKLVIDANTFPKILAVMATAGLYDDSGIWLYKTDCPRRAAWRRDHRRSAGEVRHRRVLATARRGRQQCAAQRTIEYVAAQLARTLRGEPSDSHPHGASRRRGRRDR